MKKILILDDDETVLSALSKLLKKKGVKVKITKRIQDAEYEILHNSFHVVMVDVRLSPGRHGLEILPFVQEASPLTKVFVMTGFGSKEIEEEAYKQGAYLYLEKPLDLEILTDRLQELQIFSNSHN